jgi:hypothetical protein
MAALKAAGFERVYSEKIKRRRERSSRAFWRSMGTSARLIREAKNRQA